MQFIAKEKYQIRRSIWYFSYFLATRRIARYAKIQLKFNSPEKSCFFQKNVGENFSVALVSFFNNMSVNVGGSRYLRVAKTLRDGDAIHTVKIEEGRHCMTEGMRVDVR